MPPAQRTIKIRFDGTARGLIKAAADAALAMAGFEKQTKKSTVNVEKAAADMGGGLVDALGSLPSVLKGAAIVAGVGIGAVMAPALASAIISGTLLAVGGGVLAAGIAGAAKSPKVQSAWKKFGDQAGRTLDKFSSPFIKPLVRAADTFRSALKRAEPTIVRIGATLAPVIDKLSPALALMAEKALPGILAAAQASVPLFDVLADNLPGIGGSLALFFQELARGVPAAAAFFDRFLRWVQDILPKLGGFLTWLSDLGTKMDAFSKGPEFTGLRDALTLFATDTLAGVKTGFDNIKFSIDANSETWRHLLQDIETAMRVLGPVVKWFADLVGESIGAAIRWFAILYEAIRKVVIILDTLIRGYDRLPGNVSGNGTNTEFGRIPGRAYGGPVAAGRTYMVGERGVPELFTPRQSGYITPLKAAAGGTTSVEVHVHFDDPALRDLVRVEVRESNRGLKRAVLAGSGAR